MTEKKRYVIGAVCLVFAVCLIVAGVMRGEPLIVLRKAINICMECIGIG